MINFSTVFDKNYLDKAVALYCSLEKRCANFMLYVVCFDDVSWKILQDIHFSKMTLVRLSDMETEELLRIKGQRSRAEYCWTCTPFSMEYLMNRFSLQELTYIDADLYFYSDPEPLFEELRNKKADIGIMEHRFNLKRGREMPHKEGKYCVEFNFFNDTDNGKRALNWWKKQCMDWCGSWYEPPGIYPAGRYGDQKYLELFPICFENVHTVSHLGAGVAPWNLCQYNLLKVQEGTPILLHDSGIEVPLVFYHFQNIKYIGSEYVNINSQCGREKLKKEIYLPYLSQIEKVRKKLEKEYGITMPSKKSYSRNRVKAFIQKNMMPYVIRRRSDLVCLKELR